MNQALLITGPQNPLRLPFDERDSGTDWRGLDVGVDADCFLIDTLDPGVARHALNQVRSKLLPSIYLKPLVLIRHQDDLPEELISQADLQITPRQMQEPWPSELLDGIEAINRRVNRLQEQRLKADTNPALRVIRYLYSRNREVEPRPSIRSRGGYAYPGLGSFFGDSDQSLWQTLEFLRDQHLVQTRFITRTHQCTSCGCAFLNFKETCPHCQSESLHVDNLVHHFRCGYTAELEDFKQADRLVCPKCDHTLRQIGVDYDKPSVMYHCLSCDHRFQEPEIATTCYDCQRTAPPEYQTHRDIEAYKLSMLGESAALFGLDSLFASILERRLQLLPLDLFERFVAVEKARITRYKKSISSLLLFDVKGLEAIYLTLGERTSEVYEELANLFFAMLRTSDLVSSRNESLFLMLLTETSQEDARIVEQRLHQGVSELLEASLGTRPEILSRIHAVDPSLDLTPLLEGFLNEHHAD
ncbi:MAG: hypothetical protein ABW068_04835 [Candidatus Thiodiazotropha sp.]